MTTTRFAYAIKALPNTQPAPGAPPGPPDPAADEIQPPAHDDSRPWAGDAYDEGDETDPANAFAAFTGKDGEEAWLDRAPDGTLTGWVRDATGQVWRYSDDSAWVLDVDGAQMQRVSTTPGQDPASPDGATPDGQEPPTEDRAADPYADDPATEDDDPEADPLAADDEDPDALDAGADEEDPDMEESPDEDDEDDEGEGAPFPGARKPKKKGGK
ncbi:hypothetical protein ABT033_31020 [Streptomyces pharetrae]|uniref:hypothetical protein n=1 Tax=Streptomyces pharetrae TaxID=291370 RepID=UPI003359FF2D